MRTIFPKIHGSIVLFLLCAGAAISADYFWDTSTETGYQSGNGTWGGGTYKYWTFLGGTLIAWPGAGNSATFTSGGTSAITVDGTQGVDSMAFLSSGYTLSSGTINYGSKNGLLVASGETATITSVISGTGGLKLYPKGTTEAILNLSGTNTYTGVTTISRHIRLNVSSVADGGQNSGIGASASSAANLVIDGGILRYTGEAASTDRLFTLTEKGGFIYASGSGALGFTNTGAIAFSSTGARTLEIGGSAAVSNSFSPVIGDQDAGSSTQVRKTGATSIWALNGANTYSGGTIIDAGTLRIGNGGTTGSIIGNVTDNATLIFNRSDAYTFAGVISGSGVVIQSGTDTLSLSGTNTYSGGTTISSGTLQIGNGGTTGSIVGNVTDNGTLIFNRSDVYTFAGVISGSGAMIQEGSRALTLSGANTYSGLTTVDSLCSLIVAHNTALGNTTGGTNLVAGGARPSTTLELANGITITGETVTLNSSNGIWGNRSALSVSNGNTGTWNGTITLAGNGRTQIYANGTMNLQGTINGSCSEFILRGGVAGTGNLNSNVSIGSTTLFKTDGGTWIVNTTGNEWGATQVAVGTLKLGVSGAFPSTTVVSIGQSVGTDDAILDLNTKDQTISGLYDGGTNGGTKKITNSGASASTLTIINSDDYIYSYLIENSTSAINIVKSGTGTQTLAGDNTYTGTTTVSAGTLVINGSTHVSSAVNVAAGATLAGIGNAAGNVTVENDGIIAPGNSAGTLSTGSLVLDNSSVLDFELGTTSDLISVTGDLTLDGILNITETAGFGPGDYTVIEYTGVLTDNGLDVGTTPNNFIYEISINEGTKSVILTVLPGIKLNPVIVVQSAPVCSVYTDNWTIVFDNDAGGGLTAMTDSVHGKSNGQGNQIGAGQNLYYFSYDGQNSKTNGNGTWSVLNEAEFYAIIRQSGTLNGLPYVTDYTVHGSGKIYIKTTLSNSSGDVSGKTVRCVVERRSVATMSELKGNDDASLSPYLLLSSDSAMQSDMLLSIKDLWNTSSGAANSATGFYSNASGGYTGYEHNSYSLAAGQKQVWEFMLDFMHDSWDDTTGVGEESDDYRFPDSLEMLAGMLLMEKSWEKHLRGHWKMDEGAGDTIRDNSGNTRHARTTGTWASGRWLGGQSFDGSKSAMLPDNADFDGTDFFTVMAWVKTNSGAFTAGSVVAGKHDGSNGWKLTGNGSDQVVLTYDGTAVTGTKDVGDGSWHHVAACFSPSMVILYVDGRLDKISTGTCSVTANSDDLVIG